MFDVD